MKIVVCSPGRLFDGQFLVSWTAMVCAAIAEGHELIFGFGYSPNIYTARNKCLGECAQTKVGDPPLPMVDYDKVLFIDSDMQFSWNLVKTLLESPHPISAALYYMEDGSTLSAYTEEQGFLTRHNLVRSVSWMEVKYAGMGLMAIDKAVVEQLTFPWFEPLPEKGRFMWDDVAFCSKAKVLGFPTRVYVEQLAGHSKTVVLR